jgi:hypothetical protein
MISALSGHVSPRRHREQIGRRRPPQRMTLRRQGCGRFEARGARRSISFAADGRPRLPRPIARRARVTEHADRMTRVAGLDSVHRRHEPHGASGAGIVRNLGHKGSAGIQARADPGIVTRTTTAGTAASRAIPTRGVHRGRMGLLDSAAPTRCSQRPVIRTFSRGALTAFGPPADLVSWAARRSTAGLIVGCARAGPRTIVVADDPDSCNPPLDLSSARSAHESPSGSGVAGAAEAVTRARRLRPPRRA